MSLGGVSEFAVIAESSTVAELRRIDMTLPKDVRDRELAGKQLVGDDSTVAAPPHSLGTHDRQAVGLRPFDEGVEVGAEFLGQAVVGVVVEAAVLPPGIRLEGHRVADGSAAGQPFEPAQFDAVLGKVVDQGVGVEPGVLIRTGQSADVDDRLGAGVGEQFDELVQLTIRMPNGEEVRQVGGVRHSSSMRCSAPPLWAAM